MKLKRLPLISLLFLLITLLAVATYSFLRRPYISSIQTSNITPISLTLTWNTTSKVFGCAYLIRPLPPKIICDQIPQKIANHFITVNQLQPNQEYLFLIRSGLSFKTHQASTIDISSTPPLLPNPAYGQLLNPNDNQPLSYATVLISAPQGLVSTLTTADGNWSVDLQGQYSANTVMPLSIAWQYFYLKNYPLIIGQHQPAPVIKPGELLQSANQ